MPYSGWSPISATRRECSLLAASEATASASTIIHLSGQWTENGLIFASLVGTPLSRHNVTRSWKNLLRRAELPDTKFHNLRHTCATLLLKQGTHPKSVQALLGHANIGITLDTYSHLMKGWDDGLGDAIDGALG